MKFRFSTLDTCSTVAELRSKLSGHRLQNIYDLNSKTYIFKFSNKEEKQLLLIESGIRIHTTDFSRDQSLTPNNFCMKLRKHLRTRRLTSINQIGTDRAVDFQFGEGDFSFHIVVELYASGNIILTDPSYKILMLLRVVELSEVQTEEGKERDVDNYVAVGHIYDLSRARSFQAITIEKLTLAVAVSNIEDDADSQSLTPVVKSKKFPKRKKVMDLRNALRSNLSADYGAQLIDHVIQLSGIDAAITDFTQFQPGTAIFDSLLESFKDGDTLMLECINSTRPGYLYFESDKDTDLISYQEFHPVPFNYPKFQSTKFESFNKCVDEFYSKLESQKFQNKAKQAELHAIKKIDIVKTSHANHIQGFEIALETKQTYAHAIECNLDLIDSIIKTINSFLAAGTDWRDLKEMVTEEQRNGNPIAKVCK